MGKVLQFLGDRLTNIMSGMGTSIDRRTHAAYIFTPMSPEQAEAAYRTSWLVRKIVDVPAKDMTREWRDWQADGSDIEEIEAEEKRLQLRDKCRRALILSRLYGGGALILGTSDPDPSQPLDVERVKKEGLAYVHVMAPHQLPIGQQILDPADPWFGEPEYFEIYASAQSRARLHPSRVIAFRGQRAPEGAFYANTDWYWGDPIMVSIGEAIRNADTAQAGFAALIDEAKIDIVKMPNLMAHWATDGHEQKVLDRLAAAQVGKSTWRALMLDAEEDWQQRQITWAGIPEIMDAFLNVVAGAADIPVTRLLGQSPKGLQSTGDGEERDYHAKVKGDQDEILAPALDRIDEVLIRSALGSKPDDVYYTFAPLQQPTDKQKADIEKTFADVAKVYSDTGLIGSEALQEMVQNGIVERGSFPGSEAAFASNPTAAEEAEANEADLQTAEEITAAAVENMRAKGAVNDAQAVQLITDARPRSLYVRRNLLNAAEVLAWAKAQGFDETLEAGDLHVTVLYSKAHVDWLKMGQAWGEDESGNLTVPAGGARLVEVLGDKGAVALLFGSSQLAWRHEEMVRLGASHDWDDYQPHVTITYAKPADLDLADVEPYRGKLVFGPEIFEEVDEGWQPGGGRKAGSPFEAGDRYNPNQPRDPGGEGGGQWIAVGAMEAAAGNAKNDPTPLTPEAKAQLIAANAGKDLDQLLKEARVNQAALQRLGNAVQHELGIPFAPPPAGFEVKTRDSIMRKVADEGYSGPHHLTDISRASFLVSSPEESDQVVRALSRRGTVYDKGWKQLPRDGYLDRKIYLRHPNGGLSEIQIVPQGIQQLKAGQGHQLYEIARNPRQPLEARRAAARKSRTLYNRIIRADGFEIVVPERKP